MWIEEKEQNGGLRKQTVDFYWGNGCAKSDEICLKTTQFFSAQNLHLPVSSWW